ALIGALLAAAVPYRASASQLVPLQFKYAHTQELTQLAQQLVQVQLTLRQGETRRPVGFIDAYSTTGTRATEIGSWVECTNDAAPATEIGYHGEAAMNYTPGDTYLSPATLFTAPAAGTFTCSLMAYAGDYVPDQVLPPTGIYVNGGDTSLGWDSADV